MLFRSVPGFGEEGQQALKDASVLVSRIGGLGSVVAYQLAAAGIGRLVIAHAGDIKPSDLNRQIGRASCTERVQISVVAVSLKQPITYNHHTH